MIFKGHNIAVGFFTVVQTVNNNFITRIPDRRVNILKMPHKTIMAL